MVSFRSLVLRVTLTGAEDVNATALSNLDNMYFSGKALAKFAYICLSTSLVLNDVPLTKVGLVKLKVCSTSSHSFISASH